MRRLTREHLVALREVGFSRTSMGVQDNDPVVQKAVQRDLAVVVGRAHFVRKPAISRDALALFGSRCEPGLDFLVPIFRQATVGVGLQLCFADRLAHLTSFSLVVAGWPSIIVRSFSRARDRRDMTVPIGMPSVRATSS